MATMLTHLRVAARAIERGPVIQEAQYYAGVVAPDCGGAEKNWSIPVSPDMVPKISHWTDTGEKSDCDARRFFDSYLRGDPDPGGRSFYIGYYTHLVTDVRWCRRVTAPLLEKYKEQAVRDPAFIKEIKRDWRNLDMLYQKEHPDFRAFRVLNAITAFPNSYLSYYSDTAIENMVRGFCASFQEPHIFTERPQIYLNAAELNAFIDEAAQHIADSLRCLIYA